MKSFLYLIKELNTPKFKFDQISEYKMVTFGNSLLILLLVSKYIKVTFVCYLHLRLYTIKSIITMSNDADDADDANIMDKNKIFPASNIWLSSLTIFQSINISMTYGWSSYDQMSKINSILYDIHICYKSDYISDYFPMFSSWINCKVEIPIFSAKKSNITCYSIKLWFISVIINSILFYNTHTSQVVIKCSWSCIQLQPDMGLFKRVWMYKVFHISVWTYPYWFIISSSGMQDREYPHIFDRITLIVRPIYYCGCNKCLGKAMMCTCHQ